MVIYFFIIYRPQKEGGIGTQKKLKFKLLMCHVNYFLIHKAICKPVCLYNFSAED